MRQKGGNYFWVFLSLGVVFIEPFISVRPEYRSTVTEKKRKDTPTLVVIIIIGVEYGFNQIRDCIIQV